MIPSFVVLLGKHSEKYSFLSFYMLSRYSTEGLQTVNGRKKPAIATLTDTLYPRMWTINSYLLHSFKAEKNLILSQTSILCIFRLRMGKN